MKKKAPEEKPLLFLKNDVIFKKVFGDEKNKAVLKAFLIAVLDLPPEEYDEITISDPQLRVESPDEKLGILDVYIKTREGKQIDVEIQVRRTPFMKERATAYTGKMLGVQLKAGEGYEKIKKVISILILSYNLVDDSEHFHNKYVLYDPVTGSCFTDIMEIHTLELEKVPASSSSSEEDKKTKQQIYWMNLINAEREEEIEMLATKVPEIGEAYKIMKRLSQDEEMRLLYDSREKAIRDEQARLYGAREEGRQEGIEIGIEIGREEAKRNEAEVVRNLFKMGFGVEQAKLAAATLTVSEIEEIQRQTALADKPKSTKRRKVPS
ncbi:MAG: Rpn family recombination-promoting nuclease/putative transposase [Synergistaceae bacterium]|nr:Rpn family recombination-promoting nuclease/putative transposase [Synergistaceae bacterium]